MSSLHVALVAPEIPWNTGNAGRTCLAAGASLHLVQPLGFSLGERAIRRAGLDYWARVAPRVWPDWASFEAALPGLGSPFFFAPRARRGFREAVYPERTVLVFGCESVGLPAEILARHAEQTVEIPMRDPQLRSLNLSTSVAVAAYEVLRQWSG
jgi:tRNA (cytidine/uridine-2'-O-)-methyltransferase